MRLTTSVDNFSETMSKLNNDPKEILKLDGENKLSLNEWRMAYDSQGTESFIKLASQSQQSTETSRQNSSQELVAQGDKLADEIIILQASSELTDAQRAYLSDLKAKQEEIIKQVAKIKNNIAEDKQAYDKIFSNISTSIATKINNEINGSNTKPQASINKIFQNTVAEGLSIEYVNKAYKDAYGQELEADLKNKIGAKETAKLYLSAHGLREQQLEETREAYKSFGSDPTAFWNSMKDLSPEQQRGLFKADKLMHGNEGIVDQARNNEIRELQMIEAASSGLNTARAMSTISNEMSVFNNPGLNQYYQQEAKIFRSFLVEKEVLARNYGGINSIIAEAPTFAEKYSKHRKLAEDMLNSTYGNDWRKTYSRVDERVIGNLTAALFTREETKEEFFDTNIGNAINLLGRGPVTPDDIRILTQTSDQYYEPIFTTNLALLDEMSFEQGRRNFNKKLCKHATWRSSSKTTS